MKTGACRQWESLEAESRRDHACALVMRGASRQAVAQEFGISVDLLTHWLKRRKRKETA